MAEVNETEQKARKMGWLPKEQFRGKEENWVDAEKYVQKGEEFIPFLQADRRRLEGELATTNGKLTELANSLKDATETINALKEFRTELNKERVQDLKDDLVDGIKEAREAGDVAKEESLREKLAEAKASLKEEPEKKLTPTVTEQTQADVTKLPEWDDFVKNNPWWNEDPVMRSASVEISKLLAQDGKLNGLSQTQRFNEIARVTKERFGMAEQPRQESRVEGSRGGSSRQGDESGGHSYNDLPPDAKDGASRFESRLVGKKAGQFADLAAYRKHYAEEYFKRNPNG